MNYWNVLADVSNNAAGAIAGSKPTWQEIVPWWLSPTADVLGIVGLVVTVGVALAVRKLTRHYRFTGRGPQIQRQMRNSSSELSSLLASHAFDAHTAEVTLRKSMSAASSLKPLVSGEYRRNVKSVQKAVKAAVRAFGGPTRDATRICYNRLITVEEDLKNIMRDNKWRPPQ